MKNFIILLIPLVLTTSCIHVRKHHTYGIKKKVPESSIIIKRQSLAEYQEELQEKKEERKRNREKANEKANEKVNPRSKRERDKEESWCPFRCT